MVERGQIWWYEHPEAGRRPFLILTRAAAVPVLTQVLAVPATTRVRGIPTEVALDRSDGMPRPCALAVDNLTQIRPELCTKRLATLSPARMSEVCEAIAVAVDC